MVQLFLEVLASFSISVEEFVGASCTDRAPETLCARMNVY